MMAVTAAAAVYTGGATAWAAAGWGAAAGAASLVATSMMALPGTMKGYGDSASTPNRTTSPQTGLPIVYGGQFHIKILAMVRLSFLVQSSLGSMSRITIRSTYLLNMQLHMAAYKSISTRSY